MTDFQKVMTAIKKSTDFRIVDKYGDDYDITLNDGMEDIFRCVKQNTQAGIVI